MSGGQQNFIPWSIITFPTGSMAILNPPYPSFPSNRGLNEMNASRDFGLYNWRLCPLITDLYGCRKCEKSFPLKITDLSHRAICRHQY